MKSRQCFIETCMCNHKYITYQYPLPNIHSLSPFSNFIVSFPGTVLSPFSNFIVSFPGTVLSPFSNFIVSFPRTFFHHCAETEVWSQAAWFSHCGVFIYRYVRAALAQNRVSAGDPPGLPSVFHWSHLPWHKREKGNMKQKSDPIFYTSINQSEVYPRSMVLFLWQ